LRASERQFRADFSPIRKGDIDRPVRGANSVMRFHVVALFAMIIAGSAQAGSFDDFNQGVAAYDRDDADVTIAALGRALGAGDLAPGLRYVALFDRAWAYYAKGQYPEAVEDLSAVIKQKPDYFEAYLHRAESYDKMGQKKSALFECATMLTLEQKDGTLNWCGQLAFEIGDYKLAEYYFESALRMVPGYPYHLLWLDLAKLRQGLGSATEFAEAARSLTEHGWPSPILDYFSGRNSLDDVNAAAEQGDAQAQNNQKCKVGFYIGEWQLIYNHVAEAKTFLQQAARLCPAKSIESDPAKFELARLDQNG
jgi:tetratricopeptide (TPR) repeat protein